MPRCEVCGASKPENPAKHQALLRCTRCRSVFYCGVGCQKADWKAAHKIVCGKPPSSPVLPLKPNSTSTLSLLTSLPTPPKETKSCGHLCSPNNLPACCACSDTRPILPSYPSYVDGVGHTETAARDDHYCPICNTKNYDRWVRKVAEETRLKKLADDARKAEQDRAAQLAERDRIKAAALGSSTINYSNGDVYVGETLDGERHGQGRMDYALSDEDVIYYEGGWANGKHSGRGKKQWLDDLWYEGEWRDNMMHGVGTCHMNAVDVMHGHFEFDEFCYAIEPEEGEEQGEEGGEGEGEGEGEEAGEGEGEEEGGEEGEEEGGGESLSAAWERMSQSGTAKRLAVAYTQRESAAQRL
ncbi:hypothetical protein TeGR_g8952 [Tetraparma gracilis]|uniref:MYND-type domain-containing protein n=1 Tax=Tetraparma gracilis TaxID=2962635 RepID=A0ABQ6NCV9_9STRA|nr:hypothetical protein TeGR_g8952 [Tetraparma gracilis]